MTKSKTPKHARLPNQPLLLVQVEYYYYVYSLLVLLLQLALL